MDHRISGVPLSAVEPQNTIRENRVERLIENFENHIHRESFIQDLSQTQKISKFSKESTRSPTEFDQSNRDVTSIPGHVVKKNNSRGVKHGPSERQQMYYQARQMLKKARQGKHGRHPTILPRWYADENRKSLSATGWKEHHIMLYDRIAVEKHIYTATRAERFENSKHWILLINAEGGTQQSLNQRSDFAQAKRECERLHDEHLARTQEA